MSTEKKNTTILSQAATKESTKVKEKVRQERENYQLRLINQEPNPLKSEETGLLANLRRGHPKEMMGGSGAGAHMPYQSIFYKIKDTRGAYYFTVIFHSPISNLLKGEGIRQRKEKLSFGDDMLNPEAGELFPNLT